MEETRPLGTRRAPKDNAWNTQVNDEQQARRVCNREEADIGQGAAGDPPAPLVGLDREQRTVPEALAHTEVR